MPAIYIAKQLADIQGIFVGVAVTYALGGIISLAVNRQVMSRLSVGVEV